MFVTNHPDIKNYYAKASKYKDSKLSNDRKAEKGAKEIKRRALGLCGTQKILSSGEFESLLELTGIAESAIEARELAPRFCDTSFNYVGNNYLSIVSWGDKYIVNVWTATDPV